MNLSSLGKELNRGTVGRTWAAAAAERLSTPRSSTNAASASPCCAKRRGATADAQTLLTERLRGVQVRRRKTDNGRRNRPLSNQEYTVLLHVAKGLSNQEIADEMHLSIETVRTHVKNILAQLGARNRTHAVSMAYHVGVFVGAGHGDVARRVA